MLHGDRQLRDSVDLFSSKLGPTAQGMLAEGLEPEAAVYNDEFADEVFEQLCQVRGVQVWVNPLEQSNDRTKLDSVLRRVAERGVFVSSHPDTIQKMGTKRVVHDTRSLSWGSDVRLYQTKEELREGVARDLAEGKPRVLKRYRGNGGNGTWKLTPLGEENVVARHAAKGNQEQEMPLSEFLAIFDDYLETGPVLDQEYQEALTKGMIRCYLVRDKVGGFGHQEINALFPPNPGEAAPEPTPRLYYGADKAEFQDMRRKMESEWLPEMMDALGLSKEELPLLWDADFFYGRESGQYVLCEINVSAVFPFPEQAIPLLAKAAKAALTEGNSSFLMEPTQK